MAKGQYESFSIRMLISVQHVFDEWSGTCPRSEYSDLCKHVSNSETLCSHFLTCPSTPFCFCHKGVTWIHGKITFSQSSTLISIILFLCELIHFILFSLVGSGLELATHPLTPLQKTLLLTIVTLALQMQFCLISFHLSMFRCRSTKRKIHRIQIKHI